MGLKIPVVRPIRELDPLSAGIRGEFFAFCFKMKRFFSILLSSAVFALGLQNLSAKGLAEHVVVIVWDGMRPDFITPQYTPVLYSLAQDGVFFRNHHPAYISSTEVNGTAIATGMHPDRSGIMANSDYRPE